VLRFLRIAGRWSLRLLKAFLTRRLSPTEQAFLVRGMLEDLGGLWIKVGQLLSLRIDLLPREFCNVLSKLQSQADGFTPAVARQIIEEDIGAPIEVIFDDFQDKPFATASIGQIHRAHLRREGVWVAVKVQRPYLKEKFAHDLKLISWVVGFLGLFKSLRYMRWNDAMWELKQMMEEELDYWNEASAMRRMRKTLKPHNIYVPKLFRDYSFFADPGNRVHSRQSHVGLHRAVPQRAYPAATLAPG
jgi:ubiquinone biosynthesis protein